MKDKLRGFLGFLGLVEDEYGEYGPSNAPRPFSDQPEEVEPEWTNAAPAPARTFPTQPASPSPFRARPQPPLPLAPTPLFQCSTPKAARHGCAPSLIPNAPRGVSAFSPERDVAVIAPTTYDDSRRITDLLRSNRAVVLTTLDVDQGLARRLVDFTAGTAYALNAKIEMLVRGVYLISPQGMHVDPQAKEQLRAATYHGQA